MGKTLKKGQGNLPLYHQLEVILKERINNGEFKNGDIFPCERELIDEYGVSRITVRQALSNLRSSGSVEAHPGIGTVVVKDKIDEKLSSVKSFSEEMKEHGMIMTTKESKCSLSVPPSEISDELGLERGEKCFVLERVRCADSLPVVYSITYISKEWDLKCQEGLYDKSLYEYLGREKNIVITGAKDTFEAVAGDKEISRLLGVKASSPLLKRTRISYVKDREIFEYTLCWYRADKYKYTVEL